MRKTSMGEDKLLLTAYVRENWPGETSHILRVADEVSRNYFIFDLPWDMERTYEPVLFDGEINWEYMPGEDPEFIYQMNRHRYFICLGQAYVLTGDEKYAACFVRLLTDWIRRVPLTEEAGSTTWRTIEAGLRGEYWTKAIRYFEGSESLTEEVREEFAESLRNHGEYLIRSFTGFKYSSNWGVLESHGLYLIGAYLGEDEFCNEAVRRLILEAQIQILPDGVHWEQSSMYHNEVLSCYLEVLKCQKARGCEMSRELLDGAEKMAMADLAWKKPDHTQPLYGDSDETDIRDILSNSAMVLLLGGRREQAGMLKAGGYPVLDYESSFDFGMDGVRAYEELDAGEPELNAVSLEESGNYFVRSGYGEKEDYLHFRNGSHGGGHGHSDKLHFSMVWDGEDVLTDAGRYTYVWGEERHWFKSAFAHNTVLVDGKDHVTCLDSWATEGGTPEIRQGIRKCDGYILLEGGHTGYRNVYLDRKILLLEKGLYLVLDTALAEEDHEYTRYFHFKEKQGLNREQDGWFYRGKTTEGRIWLDSFTKTEEVPGKWSPHYNKWVENTSLASVTAGKGMTVMAAVFSKGEEELSVLEQKVCSGVSGKILDETSAIAWKIRKGNRSYDCILRKQSVGGDAVLLQSGQCMGIGRVMVSKDEESTVVFY